MDAAREHAWANPSSVHGVGRAARKALETAREQVARAASARASDVVLTAGGSEACQLGVQGLARGVKRVVTSNVEHPAVRRSVDALADRGVEVVTWDLRDRVRPDVAAITDRVDADTLVAIQWVNHEVGIILPIEELALRVRERGGRLFVDATQALGKITIDTGSLGASAVAFASHKIGGPSGAGALVVAPGVEIDPLLVGGGQERGRRAGTPSVEPIVGFGAACDALDARLDAIPRLSLLRSRVEAELVARGAELHGVEHPRVATCVSASFRGRRGSLLVAAMDLEGVAVASGPACSSGLDQPSPTVLALTGGDVESATGTLRISFGPESDDGQVSRAMHALDRVLERSAPR